MTEKERTSTKKDGIVLEKYGIGLLLLILPIVCAFLSYKVIQGNIPSEKEQEQVQQEVADVIYYKGAASLDPRKSEVLLDKYKITMLTKDSVSLSADSFFSDAKYKLTFVYKDGKVTKNLEVTGLEICILVWAVALFGISSFVISGFLFVISKKARKMKESLK